MKLLDEAFLKQHQILDYAYTEVLEAQTFQEYLAWVEAAYAGELKYLTDERKSLRRSLKEFFPAAKSALVFLFSYQAAAKTNQEENDYRLASYVRGFDGEDYHHWIKRKLELVAKSLNLEKEEYTFSIDAQPVLERDLAYRAGLGWFGKNSMLISTKEGSFFIIASLILSKTMEEDLRPLETDHCGSCTRCIDACPTDAIVSDKIVDAKKCISYFTIELFKPAEPPAGMSEKQTEIFGCDICQNVCPWNRRPLAKEHSIITDQRLNFFKQDLKTIQKDLENMSNREFRRRFKGTPLERTGRVGVLKNIAPSP